LKNLNTIKIKAFIAAQDFDLSKQFYSDLGFTKASDSHGVGYFHLSKEKSIRQKAKSNTIKIDSLN
jgi:hypothetical protein